MAGSMPYAHCVSRINADGSRDFNFTPAALGTGDAYQMEVQPDGKILIAGPFSTVNGVTRNRLARLHSNGSLDADFDPASVLTNVHVESIVKLPEGHALIVADRNSPGDRTQCFYLLHANDTLEPLFNTTVTLGGTVVTQILPLPDGKTLISGQFSSLNGVSRPNLARLNPNGTVDTSFDPAVVATAWPGCLALQPDGKILVSGCREDPVDNYGGVIARLHPDGTQDTSFGGGMIEVPGVNVMFVQPDGRILIGGGFSSVHGVERPYLARLNPDGSLDPSFTPPPLEIGDDNYITSLGVQSDGNILVGGQIFDIPWETYHGVVRLHPDGSLDPDFFDRVRTDGTVFKLLIQPDDKILVDSSCTVDGQHWPGPVRLNADGSLDLSFCAAMGFGWGMALQPDGKLLVMEGNRILRLNADGTQDAGFPPAMAYGWLYALALQSDGQVLVGGEMTSVNGIPRHSIARLNNDLTEPFVVRQLTPGYAPGIRITVRLVAAPPPHVSVYAIEDRPPTGWPVTTASHGGVYDLQTGKIKFGPFYDADSRLLSYDVQPPANADGRQFFGGIASADGRNSGIGGMAYLDPVPLLHPADNHPADASMTIGEVTAYGAAWRRGETWPLPPNPIPIDYVTRAAALWRGGECYWFDDRTNAPLWWVPCRTGVSPVSELTAQTPTKQGQAGRLSDAECHMPPCFIPGEPLTVTITTQPDGAALAFAVEEAVPTGWTVSTISDGGEFDTVNGKVKWGPFLDAAARAVSYQVTPPTTVGETVSFEGVCSVDGISAAVGGPRQLHVGCRLNVQADAVLGALRWALTGQAGARFLIEASADLVQWTPLATVTNTTGWVEFTDPDRANFPHRFYRASRLE